MTIPVNFIAKACIKTVKFLFWKVGHLSADATIHLVLLGRISEPTVFLAEIV